jgi:hypothetical protein
MSKTRVVCRYSARQTWTLDITVEHQRGDHDTGGQPLRHRLFATGRICNRIRETQPKKPTTVGEGRGRDPVASVGSFRLLRLAPFKRAAKGGLVGLGAIAAIYKRGAWQMDARGSGDMQG